jgi:hypothetical protein
MRARHSLATRVCRDLMEYGGDVRVAEDTIGLDYADGAADLPARKGVRALEWVVPEKVSLQHARVDNGTVDDRGRHIRHRKHTGRPYKSRTVHETPSPDR